MQKKEDNNNQIGRVLAIISIVIGIVSFFPLIGVCLGILSIILGFVSCLISKQKLGLIGIVLGFCGIMFTVILYGSLFYFGFAQRGGIYDELRETQSREQLLPSAVIAIESYKARKGEYPDSIQSLVEENPSTSVNFVDQMKFIGNFPFGEMEEDFDIYFYYEKTDDGYYLFGEGIDGIPFTEDDIHPDVSELGETGYIKPSKD